jgi:transposase
MVSGKSGGSSPRRNCGRALHRGAPDADDGPAGRRAGQEGADHDQQSGRTLPARQEPAPAKAGANRQFQAPRPNALWVSDFTPDHVRGKLHVATWQGFVYVGFVIDTFARWIVGWRVSRSAETGFVLDALEQALYDRRPFPRGRLRFVEIWLGLGKILWFKPGMDRYVLTDAQWAKMEPQCLGKPSDPGRSGADNRRFIEAVLWIARTGSPWRDLPSLFGRWNTVFKRYRDWIRADVFKRLFDAVSNEPDMEYAMIDATIVKVHRHGQGAKGGLRARPLAAPRAA